jgi:lipid-binding SYLF domain-containing protein
MHPKRLRSTFMLAAALFVLRAGSAHASRAAELRASSATALKKLYAAQPSARMLGERAKAILVFPKILKAGFIVGGQAGDGAMQQGGKTVGYYRTVAGSYGLQAGIQEYGYALFFMNQGALDQFNKTKGFEVGIGPSLVIVDEGIAKSITSNTVTSDVYAFVFSQRGLMAGLGIQGSKITRIHPK